MNQCLFTVYALQDLEDIHDHIAEKNPENARKFVARLEKRCRSLADHPHMGRQREELSSSLRSVPEGQYVIYYRPIPDGVQIMRVFNGARDATRFTLGLDSL